MITVIGGGSLETALDCLSGRSRTILEQSKQIILQSKRQRIHKEMRALDTLDRFFETGEDFEAVYGACSSYLGEIQDAVLVAAGDGVHNGIVRKLIEDYPGQVTIMPFGLPDIVARAKEKGLLSSDALSLLGGYDALTASLDNNVPTVIYDIDSHELLGEIKLRLGEHYPDDWQVLWEDKLMPLWKVEGELPGSLFVPPVPFLHKPSYSYGDLERIVARLRTDCPWDRAQTHDSIRVNLIEEAYELLEAIDSKDVSMMMEEMGDVLLQVALHNQMALDSREVYQDDVTTAICQKMIRRHPHVYGQQLEENADQLRAVWEQTKAKEYGFTSKTDALTHVSRYLPSLIRAQKVLRKAEKAGYSNMPSKQAAFELMQKDHVTHEAAGELLLSLVTWLESQNISAFIALDDACRRLIDAFAQWENGLR